MALWKAGESAQALTQLQRALAVSEAARGPSHPDVAAPCVSLGQVLTDLGRAGEALPLLRRALAIQERSLGAQHPSLAAALLGLGEAQRRLGHPAEALAPLERALALREAARASALELATARFVLARALWDAGGEARRARAEGLAETATQQLAEPQGVEAERLRVQLEAWRAAHARGQG
jgi:tetratricopeptide (TPR) repeat protein